MSLLLFRLTMAKHAGHYLYELMQEDAMTDVTFVAQGEEIRCHRVVASCQGGYFRELLDNIGPRRDTKIAIEDVSPRIVKMVLE